MLILERRENEEILIGDDIVITIVDARRNRVRIGIVAPKSMEVHRREVYERIHRMAGDTDASDGSILGDG